MNDADFFQWLPSVSYGQQVPQWCKLSPGPETPVYF